MRIVSCEIVCHLYVGLVEIRTKMIPNLKELLDKQKAVQQKAWDDVFASHEPKKCK